MSPERIYLDLVAQFESSLRAIPSFPGADDETVVDGLTAILSDLIGNVGDTTKAFNVLASVATGRRSDAARYDVYLFDLQRLAIRSNRVPGRYDGDRQAARVNIQNDAQRLAQVAGNVLAYLTCDTRRIGG